MRLSTYAFSEEQWALPGASINFEQTKEVLDEIKLIRELYPEVNSWGDLALFTAWGSYSQDDHSLPWSPVVSRDERFLGYLYHLENGKDILGWNEQQATKTIAEIFD